MPRSYSRDIPMRQLPAREREVGAIRSYIPRTTTPENAPFIISLMHSRGHAAEDAWRLTHKPSGGCTNFWSYGECVAMMRKLTSAPRHEKERWVTLTLGDFQGQVLVDRASGHWWKRAFQHPVTQEQLALMSALRPIKSVMAMRTLQLLQDKVALPKSKRGSSGNAPAHRLAGRPTLTMEERIERWLAQHVPRMPHAQR